MKFTVKIRTASLKTYGRKFFLLYLKPIINGAGNYYIEAQTKRRLCRKLIKINRRNIEKSDIKCGITLCQAFCN